MKPEAVRPARATHAPAGLSNLQFHLPIRDGHPATILPGRNAGMKYGTSGGKA